MKTAETIKTVENRWKRSKAAEDDWKWLNRSKTVKSSWQWQKLVEHNRKHLKIDKTDLKWLRGVGATGQRIKTFEKQLDTLTTEEMLSGQRFAILAMFKREVGIGWLPKMAHSAPPPLVYQKWIIWRFFYPSLRNKWEGVEVLLAIKVFCSIALPVQDLIFFLPLLAYREIRGWQE